MIEQNGDNSSPQQTENKENEVFRRKGDLGIPVIIGLFVLAAVLGTVVFRNYIQSEKSIISALSQMQKDAPSLTIEMCAQRNMQWYKSCHVMAQICDDTVTRMMKVCLVNGNKSSQCSAFGADIFGYNFGAEQCKPFYHNRNDKKACADTWQTIADYCKATQNKHPIH